MSQQADLDVTDPDLGRPSGECANRLGDRLQRRIVLNVFPQLAQGFLEDRKQRLGVEQEPIDAELAELFEATLTFLYRLLFLLYAESRDLLPVGNARYFPVSLRKIQEEIATATGLVDGDVPGRVGEAHSGTETALYDRVFRLFEALDKGDPILNVPAYNGGLFNTAPKLTDSRPRTSIAPTALRASCGSTKSPNGAWLWPSTRFPATETNGRGLSRSSTISPSTSVASARFTKRYWTSSFGSRMKT